MESKGKAFEGELIEYINKICANELGENNEYNLLSQKCIALFNKISRCLEDKNLIFEYEEANARMNELIEITCYKLGQYKV
ncbi:MAG: hypothetical protein CVV02_15130 [Firmicutes bacterium HGW-Firmicutes-7]|nr:MAG: hypothetical protein CVV02_15130 [Firmicutes bacterium HGW-Firmicutes-7]